MRAWFYTDCGMAQLISSPVAHEKKKARISDPQLVNTVLRAVIACNLLAIEAQRHQNKLVIQPLCSLKREKDNFLGISYSL